MTRKNNVALRESNDNIEHKNVLIIFMGNKTSYRQNRFGETNNCKGCINEAIIYAKFYALLTEILALKIFYFQD